MKYLPTCQILLILLIPITAHTAPPPGHPGTAEAAKILGLAASSSEMPHRGKVLQVIDSNSYTYIEVEQKGQRRWLAAPKIALPIGASLHFPNGMVFKAFYSKVHQRTFENILFVDKVQLAK